MASKLEIDKAMIASKVAQEEEIRQQAQFIDHEIECPRCHDFMELYSDFDSLYYACKECDFCLHAIKRNK